METPLRRMSMIFFFFLGMAITVVLGQGTQLGFYASTCPNVSNIVQATVASHFQTDPTIAPALLRMHFHDCFVHGCDASILLDGPNTEKTALPNLNLHGYQVIDDAKSQLEAECPGIVSCADILALAARDSVVLTGGPTWSVPTGRRDGLVSVANDTFINLPAFNESVDAQLQKFVDKGLNAQDLVALAGGHTIGTAACQFVSYRLYNYSGDSDSDPSIDATFLPQLQSFCPLGGNASTRVGLDDGSVGTFDVTYFANLMAGRGVLESDQVLWGNNVTQPFVESFYGVSGFPVLDFNVEFGKSMVKMGDIEVKTGTDGEIRKVCSAVLSDQGSSSPAPSSNQGSQATSSSNQRSHAASHSSHINPLLYFILSSNLYFLWK